MSHFMAKVHQIQFPASARLSVRLSLRWSLTHTNGKPVIRSVVTHDSSSENGNKFIADETD